MQKVRCISAAGMLAGICLLLAACAGLPVQDAGVQNRVTLVFTNGTRGALTPHGCGCRHRGGMARRAGFVSGARSRFPGVMVLDSGNLLFPEAVLPTDRETARADFLLGSLRYMNAAAVNVSPADCVAGIDYLKRASRNLTLLSANLRDARSGAPLFAPYHISTINGVRVGVFGLSGAKTQPGLRVEEPAQAARAVVRELQHAGCAVVVLLSQLTTAANRRLLAAVPGIHFVLGSADGAALQEPLKAGDGYILSSGQHGTHAGVLEIRLVDDDAGFYPLAARQELRDRLDALEEPAPGSGAQAVDTRMRRLALEEELRALDGRNGFQYTLAALDDTVPEDLNLALLIEKQREGELRSALEARQLTWRERVATVDLSGLSELGGRRAVRLMNEITCGRKRIADCAADTPLCREMGQLVVEGVRAEQTDGKIQFQVLHELEQRARNTKNQLDKSSGLH